MRLHALAEARSLALHRLIAERIESDPTLIEKARESLDRLCLHPQYRAAWARVLGDVASTVALLRRDDDEARAMRQVTPFAGVISPQERWRIWREVKERGDWQ